MGAEQQAGLLDALHTLCDLPLDHPSVARPLAAGVQDGVPYLVHAYLEGLPADEFLAMHGPQRLSDLTARVTQAAAAIDFAAAAAVHHGALTLRDMIIGGQSTGISGFGLYQALGHEVSTADDVRGLAAITLQLVDDADRDRLGAVVSNPPGTALTFAAAIQQIAAGPAGDATQSDRIDEAIRADDPIASSVESAAASELPITGAIDASLGNARFLDVPLTTGPLADAPLGNAPLRDDRIEWVSESATDVPLRADVPSPRIAPEPDVSRATDGLPERSNGLFAASAKGEAARALDQAARAKQDAPPARHQEPAIAPAHVRVQTSASSTLFAPTTHDGGHHRSAKRVWIPLTIAAALVIGALAGFGSGYFVGQHDRQSAAAPAVAPEPTATNGQAYTESPLRDAGSATTDQRDVSREAAPTPQQPQHEGDQATAIPSTPSDVQQGPHGAAAAPPRSTTSQRQTTTEPRTAEPRSRTPRAVEPTIGTLFVDSHPTGAQVFVDGALVGRTPLLVNDVRSGEHRVRLSMPMHRTWATSVDVAGGERTRVAASLEEIQE